MARPLWSGSISFGMVTIPVRMFSATRKHDLRFHLLHELCGTRVRELRWCPTCEREVPWDEIQRGYEYASDEYVPLSKEDFQSLPLPSLHTVGLSAFVHAGEIDPIYYEKSYALEPDEQGERAFVLLLRTLQQRDLVGIGTVALRHREQLCALRAMDHVLMLETLFYPDEVRVDAAKPLPRVRLTDAELTMAASLVEALTQPFDPAAYHDQYREALEELIEERKKGRKVSPPAPASEEAKVIDLAEALRASVEAARRSRQPHSGRRGRPARRAAGG